MPDTTTIRVPTQTRDQLNAIADRRGESAGDVISKLVDAADEDALLANAAAGFERLADDPEALLAYRTESAEIGDAFEPPTPQW